ncbi:MAG: ABC-type transport auxiliary lipoprotein family protein [Acidobacteria bacterium]|nr:ABC-type transport auxiliary lipoprotein family protein [Acidobacteriota bacterium]
MSRFNVLFRSALVRSAALATLGTVLIGFSGGCGGKVPLTHYYKLDLPPAPESTRAEGGGTAIVMPFRGSKMLTQDKIIYRPSRQEVGFYEYHRWAEDPRTTLAQSLLDHLRQKKTFSRAVPFDSRTVTDYVIRGQIEQLEEVDSPDGVSIALRISAELVDVGTRQPLWHGSHEETRKVEVGDVKAIVSKMSEAAGSGVAKLAAEIDAFVRTGRAAAGSQGASEASAR